MLEEDLKDRGKRYIENNLNVNEGMLLVEEVKRY